MTNKASVAELEVLNPRQLAEFADVQVNTVYQWRKRRKINGMPDPQAILGRTPVWRLSEIVPWLRATNRLK